MPLTATLSSRFRITLPKSICAEQQWQAGQSFVLIPKSTGLLVLPSPKLEQLAGIAKGADKTGYRDR